MRKKDTSLILLKLLQEYYDRGKDIYTIKKNGVISFIDKDKTSDCHFTILKEDFVNNNHVVRVSFKPSSMINVNKEERTINVADLKKYLEEWMTWMSLYNEMKFVEDIEDPIVEFFAEEYYSSFEIIDVDERPYSIKDIGTIENVLIQLEERVQSHKQECIEQSSLEIVEEIEERIQDIRGVLYNSSKKYIAKKVSRLFGFIFKEGGTLLRESIKTIVTEVVKIGVKEVLKIE